MDVNTKGQPSAIGPMLHHKFIDTALLTNGSGQAGMFEKNVFSILIIALDVVPPVLLNSKEGMRRNGFIILFVCLIKGLKIDFFFL